MFLWYEFVYIKLFIVISEYMYYLMLFYCVIIDIKVKRINKNYIKVLKKIILYCFELV